MEKTIYIPGDLVMTNGIPIGTKKGIVYQVTESNADKYAKVKDGNAFTELKGSVTLSNLKGKTIKDDGFLFADSGAWVKDIVPIPITPEILEKNGWEPTKESLGHSFKNKKYPRFALWSINDKWNFTIDGVTVCNTLSCLCYVHELQHLLFGLNINHEMEV